MVVSYKDNGYITKRLMENESRIMFSCENIQKLWYTLTNWKERIIQSSFSNSFNNTSDYNEKRKRFWGGFGYETKKIVKYP